MSFCVTIMFKLFFDYSLRAFLVILSICYLILYQFGNASKIQMSVGIIYATVVLLKLLFETRFIKELNLLFLFGISYLIPLYYYIFSDKIITSYAHSNEIYYLSKYLVLYSIFFSIVMVSLWNISKVKRTDVYQADNQFIFYINIIICLFISLFSKSGESIFSAGGYGVSEIQNLGGFALGEYFIIFFYIAFKFSGEREFNNYLLLGVAALNILISFGFGLRNEFIQLAILLFILFYKDRGKYVTYFLLVGFAFYFNAVFASFRNNPLEFLSNPILENISPKNVFTIEGDYYISHQGDVIHSSSRLINFADNDIVPFFQRLYSFISWLASSIVPQQFLPSEANMAAFLKDQYPSGGGGSPFAYFYFWFSFFGVIFIGILLGLILRYYPKKINSIFGSYFIIIISTFPRWMSYSPINIIKMGVYSVVIYLIFFYLHKAMKSPKPILIVEGE